MPTWESLPDWDAPRKRMGHWPVSYVLAALHVAGLIAGTLLVTPFGLARIVEEWLLLSPLMLHKLRVWQPVTAMWVEVFGFWPLISTLFSVYVLSVFGREIEVQCGPRRLMAIYFSSGVYGALAHLLYCKISGSVVPVSSSYMAPAMGVLITAGLLWPHRTILLFFILPVSFRTMVYVLIGIDLLACVAYWSGGRAPMITAGAMLSAWAIHRLDPVWDTWWDRWEARRIRRRAMREYELRRRVDAILDKISAEGMGALSREERALLRRASRMLQEQRRETHDA